MLQPHGPSSSRGLDELPLQKLPSCVAGRRAIRFARKRSKHDARHAKRALVGGACDALRERVTFEPTPPRRMPRDGTISIVVQALSTDLVHRA